MKVLVLKPTNYGDRTFEPGVHEVSPSEAGSLFMAGPVRPATNAEIAEHEANHRPAIVENASTNHVPETATLTRKNRRAA